MEARPHNLISLVSRIRERANRLLAQELRERGIEGMVPSHGDLLVALLRSGRMSMKELARAVDRDKSTLTGLVDRLEELGLVKREKDPQDSRVTWVMPTDRSRQMIPQLKEIGDRLWSTVYANFSEGEKMILAELLGRVLSNLR